MKPGRRISAALAVSSGLIVLSACGGKETPSGGAPAGPEPTHPPVAIEPSASRPSGLKPGLKLTTFPNNMFTGPGETKGEASTLGFPCDQNPYNGKQVSLRYEGYLKVDKDGTYTFQITSDDESTLKLGSATVLEHRESTRTKQAVAHLKVGYYPLVMDYQNNVALACLTVEWSATDKDFVPIPPNQLLH